MWGACLANPAADDQVIPESFKQDLLNRVDIVEVIERYVQLRKGGANLSACCPFHSEKTPSFTVSPTKQFYHCFGCGAHGNAISFLMEYQGLGYVDAVKALAESAGMKLPEYGGGTKKPAASPDLYEVLDRALQYFREQLKQSPAAIDYLKRRGLTGRIAARFGIGYAPAGWRNLESVFPDYTASVLRESGLVIEADGGKRYDRFRDRVMFPILDQRARVIGFGGRVIGAGEPKYLNSPETPLFEKGRELYGMVQARLAIRGAGRVVVVEGYMDVVALAQHGVEYAVATLGTATTPVHVQKLFRQVDEVVFCFDGDAAGRKAAWHALEVALPVLSDNKTVKFLFLPPEDDPDTYIRARGREAFEQMVADARPLSEFLLSELGRRVDLGTLEGRSRLIAEAKPLVSRVAAPALQLQLVKALAEMAGVTSDEAMRLAGIAGPPIPPRQTATNDRTRGSGQDARGRLGDRPPMADRPAPPRTERRPIQSHELWLAKRLLVAPGIADRVPLEFVDTDTLESRAVRALIAFAVESAESNFDALVFERFRDTEFETLFNQLRSELLVLGLSPEQAEGDVLEALPRLERDWIRRQMDRVQRDTASGAISPDEARDRLQELTRHRAELDRRPETPPT